MKVEVVAPGDHLGAVVGSLDRRGGTILDVAVRGAAVKVIEAEAPLQKMFGYATELRSLSQGRALFSMEFDRYDTAR
jgi:elongation factor G